MKTPLILVLVFTLLSFQSIDKILGKWEIDKVTVNSIEQEKEEDRNYIEFLENGIVNSYITNEGTIDTEHSGTWIYNVDENILTVKEEYVPEEEYKIVKLDNENLIMKSVNKEEDVVIEIYFKRK
ncbi:MULTISPECIES: lipocalin family protein [unclassified Olleya]|uniref:lipocalin family protein n=1 Tax=unclassified Olleya TaxID=2615019 RepID=UPI0016473334|nr:lipocalin family protein [Olleya sp. Hel_I_94]